MCKSWCVSAFRCMILNKGLIALLSTIHRDINHLYKYILSRAQILSEKNGNWLLIESSKIEDEGTYTCQFSAVQPRVSIFYNFFLQEELFAVGI